jgi:hypothetical protein
MSFRNLPPALQIQLKARKPAQTTHLFAVDDPLYALPCHAELAAERRQRDPASVGRLNGAAVLGPPFG